MRVIKRAFYAIAIVLVILVGIGIALPGEWSVERQIDVAAPASEVFGYLDSPEGWTRWVEWPDSGSVRSGPARGPGASLAWNDPLYGSGEFRIEGAEANRRVEYTVDVEEGAIVIDGAISLTESSGVTRLAWTESGDFGWNPILGYTALSMDRVQGAQMDSTLAVLKRLIEGG